MSTTESLQKVTIHFAGDSGDGIQLAGSQFTNTTALAGNDLSTFPDFPAEIRAPMGTLSGVSGFQINFGSVAIETPGGRPDVLVAMNAAAYKKNIDNLKPGGVVVVDIAGFDKRNLRLAGYGGDANPLDHKPEGLQFYEIDVTKLNREALEDLDIGRKDKDRSRNLFVLGFLYFLYHRDMEGTLQFLREKFEATPEIWEANVRSLKAGYNYGDTIEALTRYRIERAELPPGSYRNITGNQALSLGLLSAAVQSKRELFYAGYPITPASDILHELSRHKNFGAQTFQAEDEIAAVTAAIGASFGGAMAVTATSGPGMALKTEGLGLALMLELPLVIVNVQRGGPSTGLPTKTEQSDLFQALYGRNGEAPLPIVAASSPADCFQAAFDATRMALEYMTPVILLSDGYLANGSEPWRFPQRADLPPIHPPFAEQAEGEAFLPYRRDERLVRKWALPGTGGLEHRIGGLEKQAETGDVSYEPENHEKMVKTRAQKVQNMAEDYPPTELVQGSTEDDLLILGWGHTLGASKVAVSRLRQQGMRVAQLHLKHIWPLASDLGELLEKFPAILVPELNDGQLVHLIRDKYLVDARPLNKIQGRPFLADEIVRAAQELMKQEV